MGIRRFAFTDDGISPRSRLGIDNGIFWNTGDESDEFGHITEDPILRVKMMDKRMSRLDLILKEIPEITTSQYLLELKNIQSFHGVLQKVQFLMQLICSKKKESRLDMFN